MDVPGAEAVRHGGAAEAPHARGEREARGERVELGGSFGKVMRCNVFWSSVRIQISGQDLLLLTTGPNYAGVYVSHSV